MTERVDVTALARELGPVDVVELAKRSGLPAGVVRDVMSGRLVPAPGIRQRLAAGLGLASPDA